jgi:hypothetical protein
MQEGWLTVINALQYDNQLLYQHYAYGHQLSPKIYINVIVYFILLVKAKFVVNLPITFPNSEVGRELRNEVRKFISKFELRL